MKKQLKAVREKKFIGVAELADQAARILEPMGPVQERGTVTEVPDERTVRYYLTEGLISPADDKQGTSSVFGYRHLLQLLAVKKLQTESLPIRKIRELVQDRKEAELERLLGLEGDSGTGGKNEATRYLESLLLAPPPQTAISPRIAGPPGPQTRSWPTAMLRAGQSPVSGPIQPARSGIGTALPASPLEATAWDRIQVEPGLELHIKADYEPPSDGKELRQLARLIVEAIEHHAQKAREDENQKQE